MIQDRNVKGEAADWPTRLAAANISPTSCLATDYLNHYNEVVMIIELLPDMPDMYEDIAEWRPRSYLEHFRDSGFSQAALAMEAYAHVPEQFFRPFDDARRKLDALILEAIEMLRASVARDSPSQLAEKCHLFGEAMTLMINRMAATINGNAATAADADIKALLSRL